MTRATFLLIFSHAMIQCVLYFAMGVAEYKMNSFVVSLNFLLVAVQLVLLSAQSKVKQ